jgi:hypothetical protein
MATLTQTSTDILHCYLEEKHAVPVVRCNLQRFYRDEASCFELLHPLGSCIIFVVVKNGISLEEPFWETVCEELCEKGYCSYFIQESECENKHDCVESFKEFRFRKVANSLHDQVVVRGLMDYDLIPAHYKIDHHMVDGKHCCRVWCTNDCNELYLYADLCWVRERKCEVRYASGLRYKFTADPQLQHAASPKQNAVIISPRDSSLQKSLTPSPSLQKSLTPSPSLQKSLTPSAFTQSSPVGFSDFGSYVTGGQSTLPATKLVPRSNEILSLSSSNNASPRNTYMSSSPVDGTFIRMTEYPPIPVAEIGSFMTRPVSGSLTPKSLTPKSLTPKSPTAGSQSFLPVDKIQDELLNQSMRRSATQSSYLPPVSQIPSMSQTSSYLPPVSQIPSMSQTSSYLPPVSQIPSMSRTPANLSGPSLRISNRTATPYPLNVSYSPADVIDEENGIPPMSFSESYARTSPQFV